jgi:outer membrane immunogenic protein
MKRFLLSTVAILTFAGVAAAADLPARRMAPAPLVAVVPVFTWTGFYVGIHAGHIWADEDAVIGDRQNVGFGNGAVPALLEFDNSGWMGGAQIGFNWQFGAFVAGVEADISGTDIGSESSAFFPGRNLNLPNNDPDRVGPRVTALNREMDWLGTVRARVGFAFDRWMIFGTGGFAFGETSLSGSIVRTNAAGLPNFGDERNVFGSDSDTQTGWAAGAGVEYALTNNFTVKAEWIHYDLGDQNVRLSNPSGDFADFRVENAGDIVRLGLNYKF